MRGTASAAAAGEPAAQPSGPRSTRPDRRPRPDARSPASKRSRAAVAALGTEPVVHANGYICRESFAVKDRPENFYMIGSMGLASSIGLGVALARPARPTVVFDGDGNLLMSLGILPMVGGGPVMGRGRPANLSHVVFDNGVYGSTGGQRVAVARRRPRPHRARPPATSGPTAVAGADELHAAVAPRSRAAARASSSRASTAEEQPAPRIPYSPEEIRDRFRSCFGRRHAVR